MVQNVLEYLERSAQKYPNKIAVRDETRSCTFEELYIDAKRIGSALSKKTQAGAPVPIFMEKSVTTLKLFMGVLYAGSFYVLLDVKQPKQRLLQIMETLQPHIIITSKEYEQEFKNLLLQELVGKVETHLVEELLIHEVEEDSLQSIRRKAVDIAPLYTNFTSGSTGTPKGVVVSHRSVIDFIEHFTETFHITHEDVIGNQAPFDFDVSVKDIYSAIKVGATLEIIPRKLFSFPMQLLDYLEERKVTTLIWAVSALCIITTLKGFTYKVPQYINKVLFSGEVMPMKHLHIWQDTYPKATFVNLYGPTEITCNCTYHIVERRYELGEVLPIGIPFPNEKVFLLGEDQQLVTKVGEVGELCVSGTALSLGYYNNPEQTQKAFVQNPLNKTYIELIYKTGDMAYYNEREELCFASRKDFQIKHMGHRIELGEIEVAFDAMEGIQRACCLFNQEKGKIIAYYQGSLEKKQVVSFLREKLPVFMVPNKFIKLDALPLTKNGKIDRNQLKNLDTKR